MLLPNEERNGGSRNRGTSSLRQHWYQYENCLTWKKTSDNGEDEFFVRCTEVGRFESQLPELATYRGNRQVRVLEKHAIFEVLTDHKLLFVRTETDTYVGRLGLVMLESYTLSDGHTVPNLVYTERLVRIEPPVQQ